MAVVAVGLLVHTLDKREEKEGTCTHIYRETDRHRKWGWLCNSQDQSHCVYVCVP